MVVLTAALPAGVLALLVWRRADVRAVRNARRRLSALGPSAPRLFDVAMVAGLPAPAQRFFRFAIAPGTTLHTVAEIAMTGELGLGSSDRPGYLPMRAEQVLAAPYGFVWSVEAGGRFGFSGSDGAVEGKSWSRFWWLGFVPIARAGNSADHLRSAFGRYVAEAVFWTPAALLPAEHVRWEAVDDSTARVVLIHRGLEQAVEITVDDDGRPGKVVFQRWSDANAAKRFQLQPFGGYLSDYRVFDGFRLPTRVEAGNHFETDAYFPFFKATVTDVRFLSQSGDEHGGSVA